MSVVFAVCGGLFGTWASRVSDVAVRLGLTPGQMTVAVVGLAAGSVAMLPLAGAVITKAGSKIGALAGMTVLGGCLLAVPLAGSLWTLTAVLVGLGMGNSLLDVSMNAHAARVEQEYGRPIFAGFHAFWNVGGLAAAVASTVLASLRIGIGTHFPIAACVLVGLGFWAVTSLWLRGPDRGQGGAAFALPDRILLPLAVIAFCGFVAEGAVNDWSSVYLTSVDAADSGTAPLAYFAFSIAMTIVRLGTDKIVTRTSAVLVMRIAAITAVLGFGVLLAVTVTPAGIVGFGLVGAGVAAIVPLAWSAAGQAQPDRPGQAITAVATAGYLGFLLGPALVGGVTSVFGLRIGFLGAVALTALVIALAPTVRVRRR